MSMRSGSQVWSIPVFVNPGRRPSENHSASHPRTQHSYPHFGLGQMYNPQMSIPVAANPGGYVPANITQSCILEHRTSTPISLAGPSCHLRTLSDSLRHQFSCQHPSHAPSSESKQLPKEWSSILIVIGGSLCLYRILLRAQLVHVRPVRYQRLLPLSVTLCAFCCRFSSSSASLLLHFWFLAHHRGCPNL